MGLKSQFKKFIKIDGILPEYMVKRDFFEKKISMQTFLMMDIFLRLKKFLLIYKKIYQKKFFILKFFLYRKKFLLRKFL